MKQHLHQRKKSDSIIGISLVLALGAIMMMLTACSDSEKGSVQPAPAARKTAQQPVTQPTSTVMKNVEQPVFSYASAGRRDPFSPLVSKAMTKERASARPPLERYTLSEFKLSGIVWGGFGYNAMVEGPDGKGYFVRVGTTIGSNKGVVKAITKDTVVIEEKFKNVMGATERKQITIQLRKIEEGMQ